MRTTTHTPMPIMRVVTCGGEAARYGERACGIAGPARDAAMGASADERACAWRRPDVRRAFY